MIDGAAMIAAERQRQVDVEGWTAEHDAEHQREELICAAGCYLHAENEHAGLSSIWPWDTQWWKPKDQIHNLTVAGALIAAEIDRLQAAASQEPKP